MKGANSIMNENPNHILGIMRARFATPGQAQDNAMSMKDCPRLILSGTTKNVYYGVFALQDDMRGLFTYLEDNPTALGADAVELSFIDKPIEEFQMPIHLEGSEEDISPCGSDCSKCSLKSEFNCPGCPATTYYDTRGQMEE